MTPSQRHSDEPTRSDHRGRSYSGASARPPCNAFAACEHPAYCARNGSEAPRAALFAPRAAEIEEAWGSGGNSGRKISVGGDEAREEGSGGAGCGGKTCARCECGCDERGHSSRRLRAQMRPLVRLAPGMRRSAMRSARHLLRSRVSRRVADAIRIWCLEELWRIATVTHLWCRIRRCRGWMEIYSSGAMGWGMRCMGTACWRASNGGEPMGGRKAAWCDRAARASDDRGIISLRAARECGAAL